MKKSLYLLLILCCSMFSGMAQKSSSKKGTLPNFYKVRANILKQLSDPALAESAGEEDGMYTKFKRWEYFMKPRTFPSGKYFAPDKLMNEFNSYFKAHPKDTRQQQGGG